QNISADAPEAHAAKQGTPTMGGLLILFSFTLIVLIYIFTTQIGAHRRPEQDFMLPALLLLTLAFGGIGFADDYLSARRGRNLGLRAREKFGAQCLVAIGFALWLARTAQPGLTTSVTLAPSLVTAPRIIDFGW